MLQLTSESYFDGNFICLAPAAAGNVETQLLHWYLSISSVLRMSENVRYGRLEHPVHPWEVSSPFTLNIPDRGAGWEGSQRNESNAVQFSPPGRVKFDIPITRVRGLIAWRKLNCNRVTAKRGQGDA